MKEAIIKFETAKLAMQCGYPQDSFNTSWYNFQGVVDGRTDLDINGEYVNEDGLFQSKEEKANNISDIYLAPNQNLLQKFIREKYKIHTELLFSAEGMSYGFEIIKAQKYIGFSQPFANNPEVALEVALKETLILIIKEKAENA